MVAGLALLVTGCSGAGSGVPAARAPEGPADGGLPEAPAPAPVPGERQIARTANISLVVADVAKASVELRRVAESVNGLVTSENISLPADDDESGGYAEAVVSVPADRLDESLTLIGGLGEVRQRSVQSVDVTDSVLDVDARVKTMRESIARLQDLMERAGSVAEIAAVEAELSQRQADLESLLAQQKNLQDRVAMSPITVALYPPERAFEAGADGFVGGLLAGWSAMVTAGRIALTVVGALLPWAVLAALIGVPLLWWRRRRRAARPPASDPRPPAPAQPAQPPVPPSTPAAG